MATEVLMPRQGQSVESCLIVEWKKNEGDSVSKGDILCEVETDKATFEVEAPASGVLLRRLYQADEDVPVLTPIAYIGEAGERINGDAAGSDSADNRDSAAAASPHPDAAAAPERAAATESPAADGEAAAPTQRSAAQPRQSSGGGAGSPEKRDVFISPRARRLVEQRALDYSGLSGSGPGGRIIERDIEQALQSAAPLTAAARAAAEGAAVPEHGSGIGGRVRLADLQPAGGARGETAAGETPDTTSLMPEFPGPSQTTPLKGVRKLIAQRMLASLQNSAQLTLNSSADARALQALRARFKQADEALGLREATINDLLHLAVSRTLVRFAYMNSHLADDAIRSFHHVHLGFAVDTPRGLMVPTIRFADRLSLAALSSEARRLAAACQAGNADPGELAHATFTVTNLGGLGVEHFTPVLNPPQVAILGVSNIQLKPVSADNGTQFVPSIGLSLTIDHRAVDGAPAARFLQALCRAIADIDLTLAL